MGNDDIINIAKYLTVMAARNPDKEAIAVPSGMGNDGEIVYRTITFAELDRQSNQYAHGMAKFGITKGVRVLLMVRPGFDFITITFALFKAGAVPVFIDPGMGKSNLLNSVRDSKPEVMIAIGKAQIAKLIYPKYFKSIKRSIIVGKGWYLPGTRLEEMLVDTDKPFEIAETKPYDMASIIFTTGSTGPPKGAVYTHAMFEAELAIIRDHYGLTEADVDLPVFPLFALFSIALGMNVVIPEMDPTRPTDLDPKKMVYAIMQKNVSFSFGSPAVWDKVSAYCAERGIRLLPLKKVLMAGAPVAREIHERLLDGILQSGAMTHSPFGCTEGLPVCDITGSEVIAETSEMTMEGAGICVGTPLSGNLVQVIKLSDDPIPRWSEELIVPQGDMGEIVISGAVVSHEYFGLPRQTKLHKIYDERSGRVWHRMGDAGYIDKKGRLWFCGRKSHRVIAGGNTLFADQCEALFNADPFVARTALVGVGIAPDQTPVIIAELNAKGRRERKELVVKGLLEIAKAHKITRPIETVLLRKEKFPTDIRHNAKIFREQLKAWAEKKL